ncbi:hypothetical protein AZA_47604 [Nitrospirillum viridazoti Y2]|nr:hypothetical protein AZA_47604 [Nitrospirillum amazonense Y2]
MGGAGQQATVDQGGEGAAAGHIDGGGRRKGAAVGDAAQRTADIVVTDREGQAIADGALRGGQAGDAADLQLCRHGGTARRLQQGAGPHQIVGGGGQVGQHGTADGGGAADHQFSRLGVVPRQHQAAADLAVIAADRHGIGQRQGRAAVHHGMAGGDEIIVQQQGTGREDHVAPGISDRAPARQARQRAQAAAAGAGEHQVLRRVVHDGAADHATVGDSAQRAVIVQRRDTRQGAAGGVHQNRQRAAVVEADGAGDGAAVGNGGDAAAVVQAGAGHGADQARVADQGGRTDVVEAVAAAGDGAAVGQGAQGADICGRTASPCDGAVVHQGADDPVVGDADHTARQ